MGTGRAFCRCRCRQGLRSLLGSAVQLPRGCLLAARVRARAATFSMTADRPANSSFSAAVSSAARCSRVMTGCQTPWKRPLQSRYWSRSAAARCWLDARPSDGVVPVVGPPPTTPTLLLLYHARHMRGSSCRGDSGVGAGVALCRRRLVGRCRRRGG